MIFYWILFVSYVLYYIKNKRNALCLYIAMFPFLHFGICLWQSPTLTLQTAIAIFLGLASKWETKVYPFMKFCILYSCSLFISLYIAGFGLAINYFIQNIFVEIILVLVFLRIVKSENDLRYCVKSIIKFSTIMCLYGIFECVIRYNPLLQLENALVPDSAGNLYWISTEIRYGIFRSQSVTQISIVFGTYCALQFIFFTCLARIYGINHFFKNERRFNLFLFLLFIGVVISVSKSSYLCLSVGLVIAFFNTKYIKSKYLKKLILILPIIIVFFVFLYTIIMGAMSTNNVTDANGSNYTLRQNQFEAVKEGVVSTPFLGHGLKSMSKWALLQNSNMIAGLESEWFWIIFERGFLGAICYFLYCFSLPLIYKNRDLFALSFAWIVTITVTTLPSLECSYMIILSFIIIKINKYGNNSIKGRIGKPNVSICSV